MNRNSSLTYYPEIDGLRALAVLPVLLFHAGFGFPGGFAGVDVFFVISGFLIGSVIVKAVAAGQFSLLSFWIRRIRRLLPAWALVVLVTSLAASFSLVPPHLKNFGEALFYQPIPAANIYYWNQTGYFETASDLQPLLHTWSLALEEQFYILLPIFLIPTLKLGRKFTLIAWLIVLAVSLAVSIYYSARHPGFAFFMLPSRIWELGIGVILAMMTTRGFTSRKRNELGALLGIGMIVASYFLLDHNSLFPSYTAALPCVGTGLFLYTSGGGATMVGRLLSRREFVWVGKISYPLYLWHWPAIVFLRYNWIEEPPVWLMNLMLGAVFLLAWLTWKFVESPIRSRRIATSNGALLKLAAATGITILMFGFVFDRFEGFPSRYPEEVNRLAAGLPLADEPSTPPEPIYSIRKWQKQGGPCLLGETEKPKARLLVWGDSHALMMADVIDQQGTANQIEVVFAAEAGIAPVPNTFPAGRGPKALPVSETVEKWLTNESVEGVLFIAKWPMYLYGRNDGKVDRLLSTTENRATLPKDAIRHFNDHFRPLVRQLESRGIKVWVMRTVAYQPRRVPETLAQIARRGKDLNLLALPVSVHRKKDKPTNDVLDSALANTDVRMLDPIPFFVDDSGTYLMAKNRNGLYSDDNHLSAYGASLLAPMIDEAFKELVK